MCVYLVKLEWHYHITNAATVSVITKHTASIEDIVRIIHEKYKNDSSFNYISDIKLIASGINELILK